MKVENKSGKKKNSHLTEVVFENRARLLETAHNDFFQTFTGRIDDNSAVFQDMIPEYLIAIRNTAE